MGSNNRVISRVFQSYRLRPVGLVWLGVVACIILFSLWDDGGDVTIYHRDVAVDTVRYVSYDTVGVERRVPVPVVRYVDRVVLADSRERLAFLADSLRAVYDAELEECRRRYEDVLSQLYRVSGEDTIGVVHEQELHVYRDSVKGDGYTLDWEIGVMGRLNHFYPSVGIVREPYKRWHVNGGLLVSDGRVRTLMGVSYDGLGRVRYGMNYVYGGGVTATVAVPVF